MCTSANTPALATTIPAHWSRSQFKSTSGGLAPLLISFFYPAFLSFKGESPTQSRKRSLKLVWTVGSYQVREPAIGSSIQVSGLALIFSNIIWTARPTRQSGMKHGTPSLSQGTNSKGPALPLPLPCPLSVFLPLLLSLDLHTLANLFLILFIHSEKIVFRVVFGR